MICTPNSRSRLRICRGDNSSSKITASMKGIASNSSSVMKSAAAWPLRCVKAASSCDISFDGVGRYSLFRSSIQSFISCNLPSPTNVLLLGLSNRCTNLRTGMILFVSARKANSSKYSLVRSSGCLGVMSATNTACA